ncbi:E3 ubiquitin-protein ligase MBR1 [Linum perenne]
MEQPTELDEQSPEDEVAPEVDDNLDIPIAIRKGDLMMFDGSYLYGSRNMSDQYGDMRLDIDNMSYEELLALGDSIGNVNTGLSGNVVSECLLEKKHSISDKNVQVSCAICLEEYKKTSRKGKLKKCGHEYHIGCIKKWLSMKNSCPICKGPAAVLSDQE